MRANFARTILALYFFSLFHPLTAPAGAKTFRPFARRFLSTLRPDALAMRVRNPLVRARLRRVPPSVHPIDFPPAVTTNAPRCARIGAVARGASATTELTDFFAARRAADGALTLDVDVVRGSASASADMVNAGMTFVRSLTTRRACARV